LHVVTPPANGDSGTSREQRSGNPLPHNSPDREISGAQMMFLDCPAYLDQEGAVRCGLPAEVRSRFTMRSTDGPLESVMILCPSGHWFNGPIGSLTCESTQQHGSATTAGASGAWQDSRIGRPNGAPPYYLSRPGSGSPPWPRRAGAGHLPPRWKLWSPCRKPFLNQPRPSSRAICRR